MRWPRSTSNPWRARRPTRRARRSASAPRRSVHSRTWRRWPTTGCPWRGARSPCVRTRPGGPGPHPALVYYHGGGWVIGDLYTHDGLCRSLTNAARCLVVSVDYRRAPESKYPVAAEDSYAALCWVVANAARLGLDPRRVAVGGDSAGGNLATVAALMARARGGPALVHQVLIYPVTDHDLNTQSYIENATGYVLTREGMRWFWRPLSRPGVSGRRAPRLAAQGKEPGRAPVRARDHRGVRSAS